MAFVRLQESAEGIVVRLTALLVIRSSDMSVFELPMTSTGDFATTE